ncbi:hypothetical protein [Candidatus Cardinium sp. cBcalN1]|uniref:hypothetical protein n=1 Tax=Candidatus Cardinium sp. cBcalN1 TaxID=2699437 RepID=UPI001FB3C193|nr:hypothetical protein [Candidatus Cardinium sp. cBcalN1]
MYLFTKLVNKSIFQASFFISIYYCGSSGLKNASCKVSIQHYGRAMYKNAPCKIIAISNHFLQLK